MDTANMKLFGRSKQSITRSRSQLHAWSWMQQTIHFCISGLWQVRRTILIATSVYGVVLLLLLPFICTNLPYCKLYRNRLWDFESALEYNHQRLENAYRIIATLEGKDIKKQYDRHETVCCPRFAIGVITTRRGFPSDSGKEKPNTPRTNYLTQVMARLHHALEVENATSYTALFMCNVDAYHEKHNEFHALKHLFPHRTMYEESARFPFVATYEKEKLDYKYCLREALKYNPEYVIMVEDDAYPHLDFLTILEHILKTRIEMPTRAGNPSVTEEDWLWLKLNFPDSLSFFERNWYFALEWIALSLFFSGSFTLFLHIFHLCKTVRLQHISNGTINVGRDQLPHLRHMTWLYLVFVLSFLLVFLCLLILERPYFTRWRAVSKYLYTLGPGTSCCTPAVLFPAGQVPYIIGYLQHIRCSHRMPLDFALEDYRIRRGLRQFLISPNLFRHIGMFSSLTKSYNKKGAANYLFLD